QHGFIRVQEYSVQGNDAAGDGVLAEDRGKSLLGLLQGDLRLLALSNVNHCAANQAPAVFGGDHGGSFQRPEQRPVSAALPAFVIRDFADGVQGCQKRVSFRGLDVQGQQRSSKSFLFGFKAEYMQKRAVAVQQRAFDGGEIDPGQVSFKQRLILRRRARGQFGLVFKQSQDHPESYKELGEVPQVRRRGDGVGLQNNRNRKNQSPGKK